MLVPFLFSLALAAPPSPVAMPGEAEAQRFKAFFEKGEALYQKADYGAAVWNFRRADGQRVTPEVAYDLAKCHERLGEVAFATYYYRLYMKRAPSAPDVLDVAELVGGELAKAESDGRGFLELEAPRASAITVNRVVYPEPPVAVFLPPGDYEVSADFPAGRRTMQVSLTAGKTTSVSFEPVQPPAMSLESALPGELVARGLTAPEKAGPKPLRLGSFVALGLGAAALGTGLGVGAMARADGEALGDRSLSVSGAQALADSANAKGLAANGLLLGGGLALAAGALMFVFSLDGAPERKGR